MSSPVKFCFSQYWPCSERHSRYNLSVIDQILQRVSAGEVIVEVGRVADKSLVGPGRVYVPGNDDRLDG